VPSVWLNRKEPITAPASHKTPFDKTVPSVLFAFRWLLQADGMNSACNVFVSFQGTCDESVAYRGRGGWEVETPLRQKFRIGGVPGGEGVGRLRHPSAKNSESVAYRGRRGWEVKITLRQKFRISSVPGARGLGGSNPPSVKNSEGPP
jgi:hypothetical protein